MTVIKWFKRRTKSKCVDDKAVGELERVLNGARRDSSDDLAAFLSKPETEQLAGMEDLAKMLER